MKPKAPIILVMLILSVLSSTVSSQPNCKGDARCVFRKAAMARDPSLCEQLKSEASVDRCREFVRRFPDQVKSVTGEPLPTLELEAVEDAPFPTQGKMLPVYLIAVAGLVSLAIAIYLVRMFRKRHG